jgi:hypothetical protein
LRVAEVAAQHRAHENENASSHVAFNHRNCTLKANLHPRKLKESEVQDKILGDRPDSSLSFIPSIETGPYDGTQSLARSVSSERS